MKIPEGESQRTTNGYYHRISWISIFYLISKSMQVVAVILSPGDTCSPNTTCFPYIPLPPSSLFLHSLPAEELWYHQHPASLKQSAKSNLVIIFTSIYLSQITFYKHQLFDGVSPTILDQPFPIPLERILKFTLLCYTLFQ